MKRNLFLFILAISMACVLPSVPASAQANPQENADMLRHELKGTAIDSLIWQNVYTYTRIIDDTTVFAKDGREVFPSNILIKRDKLGRLVSWKEQKSYMDGNCEVFYTGDDGAYFYVGDDARPAFAKSSEIEVNGRVEYLFHYIYGDDGLLNHTFCYCYHSGVGIEFGYVIPFVFYTVEYNEYTYLEFDDHGNWTKREVTKYSLSLPEGVKLNADYRRLFSRKTNAKKRAELEEKLLQKLKSDATEEGEKLVSYKRTESRIISYRQQ